MSYRHEHIPYHSGMDIICNQYDAPGSFVTKHWHNSLEIIYLMSGELTCYLGSNKEKVLSAGDFVLVNSRELHAYASKTCTRQLLIQVPYPFLARYIPRIDSVVFRVTPGGRREGSEKAYFRMQELLFQISRLPREPESEFKLRLHSLLFELLYLAVHFFREEVLPEEQEKTDKYIHRLGMVAAYVREHYAEDITLSEISEVVSLNPDYFTRFFKKYMGMTFLDYVNSVRLEHIDMDLLETDLSIHELLELHGFTNYKLFLKMYRSRFGCSPNEMRKRAREQSFHTAMP